MEYLIILVVILFLIIILPLTIIVLVFGLPILKELFTDYKRKK